MKSIIPNEFKQKLLAGDSLIGCWCALANPISTEVLGTAGFDWLLLDGEHAPNDITTFIPQLMALKDSVSAPIVRPTHNDKIVIKRLLDIGFYNFLIPFVESAEDAEKAVAATRYPPYGVRGVSVGHRSNRFGTVPDYFQEISKHISVLVQIESQAGIDNIRDIAGTEGVDGVFIGPGDLSAALGYIGQPNHPEVQKAIKAIFEVCAEFKKPYGILAPNEEDARRYIEWGATFVAVGSDLGVFKKATGELCNKFKK